MALYRAKPVEIEAVRWDGSQFLDMPPWLMEAMAKEPSEVGAVYLGHSYAFLRQPGGSQGIAPGEFLTLQDGHFAIMKAERVLALYTPVAEDAA